MASSGKAANQINNLRTWQHASFGGRVCFDFAFDFAIIYETRRRQRQCVTKKQLTRSEETKES